MALTDSLPTGDSGGLTVTDERLILAGLVVKNADGTPRVGVLPSGTTPLVTGRASMGYDVAPFQAATSRTGTGVELLANDAMTTVVTTAAPGANSRIDVIWVRPQFTANADSANVPLFGVTQGVAAGVPTAPAIPAGALELAQATILSTTTTTGTVVISQTAPFTAAAGGTVWLRNSVEQAAFTPPIGTTGYRLDLGSEVHYESTGWQITLRPGLALIQRIDFTAATSVPFTGFSSQFENYLAVLEVNASSTPSGGTLRMRSGGADNSTANYTAQQQTTNSSSVTGVRVFGQAAFPMLPLAAVEHSMRIEFSRPNIAAPTRIDVTSQSVLDANNIWGSTVWGRHNVASAFDGFNYIPSAGNITGSLTVYGRA